MQSDVLRRGARFVPAACFTLVWLTTLLAPSSVKPLAATLAAFGFGVPALAAGLPRARGLGAGARAALIALGVALAALLAGAFALPSSLVSVFGVVGQHNGWLLWAGFALWLAAGAFLGRGSGFRWVVWSLGVLGGVAGVFALLDAAHVLEIGARYSPEVSGLLESSISLGQLLLLGLGGAGALVAIERDRALRVAAGGLFAVQVAALAVSGARTAQLAFAAGVVLVAGWAYAPRLTPAVRRALQVLALLAAVAVVVAVAAIAVAGPGAGARLGAILTDRPTIWHSAAVRVPQHLLLGEGPDRFSAIETWSVSGAGVPYTATNSPHDLMLDLLLGGGAIALVAFLAAVVLAGRDIVRGMPDDAVGPRVLAVAVAMWLLSLLAAWTDPLSAFAAALLAGALLSEGAAVRAFSPVRVAATAVVALTAVAVLVVGSPLFANERGWAADRAEAATASGESARRWAEWPDPAFAAEAMATAMSRSPQEAGATSAEVLDRVPWDASSMVICAEIASQRPPGAPPVADVLAAGRKADPASGIWDAIAKLTSRR